MTSLNGFLTGLPDVGLYVNYMMGRHGDVDGLGIGAMMKRMGYKTVFWYGGLRSWQDIEPFTLREALMSSIVPMNYRIKVKARLGAYRMESFLMRFGNRCRKIRKIRSISS